MADSKDINVAGFVVVLLCCIAASESLLYPRESETREIKDLSGKWKFKIDDSQDRNQSFREQWWKKPLQYFGHVIDMPVPASYNDITQNSSIRDFVGWAWYERDFYPPTGWKSGPRVWLRVGSAHYQAVVYLNGKQVMEHSGGHLPFEYDVTSDLLYGQANRLTIAVNNTLTLNTLPPGSIKHYSTEDGYPRGYFTQEYQFDFFNYAGIHRPVKLYTVPEVSVGNIVTTFEVGTDLINSAVLYDITVKDMRTIRDPVINATVVLKDAEGNVVKSVLGLSGRISLSNQHLWWPVGMNTTVGYLHTLMVMLSNVGSPVDVYRLPIGIRTVEVSGTTFLINHKPFYFHGFGRHEDWNIRGKGMDWSMIVKDFNMIDWLGANSFRTSHYPYSEEIMQMCDERGIVVIDECPAVGMKSPATFVNKTLQHHLEVMSELVSRDMNHPSVVMWSIANEPASNLHESEPYFKTVLDYTRSLDSTRPVTFVCNELYSRDLATPYVDVVSVNEYEAWYTDSGHTELIQQRLGHYLDKWHQTRPTKPIIHMEWGAGAISGFHANPTAMWTEGYLVDLMREHFAVFDKFRNMSNSYFIGEMIWNYADFNTAQSNTRVLGNRKGLLTRDRQPKWPAYFIRERYHALLSEKLPKKAKHQLKLSFQADFDQFDF